LTSGRASASFEVVRLTSSGVRNSSASRSNSGPPAGGGRGEFGSGRFHHREDGLAALREGVVHGVAERGPLRGVVDQLADVGVDLEMLDGIDAAERGDHERQRDDQQRAAHRPGDESDE
jgi:hypothetical protein